MQHTRARAMKGFVIRQEHGMDMARDVKSMGRPQQLLVELATRFQHLILSSHGFWMIMPLCDRRRYERS